MRNIALTQPHNKKHTETGQQSTVHHDQLHEHAANIVRTQQQQLDIVICCMGTHASLLFPLLVFLFWSSTATYNTWYAVVIVQVSLSLIVLVSEWYAVTPFAGQPSSRDT